MNDPLAAIPLQPTDVEIRHDSLGHVHLRRQVPVTGLRKLLRQDFSQRVELDEFGSRYYGLIDGRRNLRAIVEQLTTTSGRTRQEVEEGVVVFTKQLMTKHLVQLQVPA